MERNDAILETNPDPKYQYLVDEIISDKLSGGLKNMYKDFKKTSYDIIVAKYQSKFNILNDKMKENRKLMENTIKRIENSYKKPDEEGYEKISPKEVENLQKLFPKLQDEFVEYKSSSETFRIKLEDIIFNQYLESGKMLTMRYLRNKFIEDNDKLFLEKGVTWAFDYAARHRIDIDITQYS
uniref:Uncharacterized protein n=1 Tax=viral metagenome TaxID=1070528 RepID=A0A6C0ANE5_9ZZZZ